jgi:hypothetical protein
MPVVKAEGIVPLSPKRIKELLLCTRPGDADFQKTQNGASQPVRALLRRPAPAATLAAPRSPIQKLKYS